MSTKVRLSGTNISNQRSSTQRSAQAWAKSEGERTDGGRALWTTLWIPRISIMNINEHHKPNSNHVNRDRRNCEKCFKHSNWVPGILSGKASWKWASWHLKPVFLTRSYRSWLFNASSLFYIHDPLVYSIWFMKERDYEPVKASIQISGLEIQMDIRTVFSRGYGRRHTSDCFSDVRKGLWRFYSWLPPKEWLDVPYHPVYVT